MLFLGCSQALVQLLYIQNWLYHHTQQQIWEIQYAYDSNRSSMQLIVCTCLSTGYLVFSIQRYSPIRKQHACEVVIHPTHQSSAHAMSQKISIQCVYETRYHDLGHAITADETPLRICSQHYHQDFLCHVVPCGGWTVSEVGYGNSKLSVTTLLPTHEPICQYLLHYLRREQMDTKFDRTVPPLFLFVWLFDIIIPHILFDIV